MKSEDVQRAVTFAAAALIRDSALCEAQYAVFSVFKMFEFNTFTSLPSNFTTTTDSGIPGTIDVGDREVNSGILGTIDVGDREVNSGILGTIDVGDREVNCIARYLFDEMQE